MEGHVPDTHPHQPARVDALRGRRLGREVPGRATRWRGCQRPVGVVAGNGGVDGIGGEGGIGGRRQRGVTRQGVGLEDVVNLQ